MGIIGGEGCKARSDISCINGLALGSTAQTVGKGKERDEEEETLRTGDFT
jgi:hypothetical protein